MLTVQCFSTENLTFYSTGSEVERLQKIEYISQFPIVQKNLDICWSDFGNCRKDYCGKCQRTLLELFSLDVLEKFRDVFDVDTFMANIDEQMGVMLYQKKIRKLLQEIYEFLIEKGYVFSEAAQDLANRLDKLLDGVQYPEVRGIGSVYLIKLRNELLETTDMDRIEEIRTGLTEFFEFTEASVRITSAGYREKWLSNEIDKKDFTILLRERGWENIAIYGDGKAVRNLVKKLSQSGMTPSYIVSDNIGVSLCGKRIKVVGVNEKWDKVDVMIVASGRASIVESELQSKFSGNTILMENLVRIV
jgi:hypothetical protein